MAPRPALTIGVTVHSTHLPLTKVHQGKYTPTPDPHPGIFKGWLPELRWIDRFQCHPHPFLNYRIYPSGAGSNVNSQIHLPTLFKKSLGGKQMASPEPRPFRGILLPPPPPPEVVNLGTERGCLIIPTWDHSEGACQLPIFPWGCPRPSLGPHYSSASPFAQSHPFHRCWDQELNLKTSALINLCWASTSNNLLSNPWIIWLLVMNI